MPWDPQWASLGWGLPRGTHLTVNPKCSLPLGLGSGTSESQWFVLPDGSLSEPRGGEEAQGGRWS